MDKWICEDCGIKVYEEDLGERPYTERFEYWGANITHTFYEACCPECGSTEISRYYGKMDDEDDEEEEEEE